MSTITKASAPQRAMALGARRFRFTISTGDLDRTGDRIEPPGWQLADYRKNPCVLFGHRHDVPAIARSPYIAVEGGRLVADAEFPPPGIHPLADTVHGLLHEGFLVAASVGFQPVEGRPNRDGGTDWTAQILREWSVVNVPALGQAEIARCAATVDRTAVTKWLGAGRDDAPVLRLADEDDDLVTFEPRDLVAALAEVRRRSCARVGVRVPDDAVLIDVADIAPAWDAARQRSALRVLGRPDGPIAFTLVEEPDPGTGELFHVDPADVRAGVHAALRAAIDREVKAAIGYARGRVD